MNTSTELSPTGLTRRRMAAGAAVLGGAGALAACGIGTLGSGEGTAATAGGAKPSLKS
ncbi:MAG: hypothetical protein HY332_11450 [Chloroflexi bacterium]|nr:hypothetical protein [Chloroflexota bacterium]